MEQKLKDRIEEAKKLFPYDENNIIVQKDNEYRVVPVQNMVYYSALHEVLYDLGLNDKDKDDPIVRTITALKQELNRYQAIYGRL
jgi:hypothetical protein